MDTHTANDTIYVDPACPRPVAGPSPKLPLSLPKLEQGTVLRLIPHSIEAPLPLTGVVATLSADWFHHSGSANPLAIGVQLRHEQQPALLRVLAHDFTPLGTHAQHTILLQALAPIEKGDYNFSLERAGYALAWITLSDKGAHGLRQDKSGPLIPSIIQQALALRHVQGFLLPDNPQSLKTLLLNLATLQGYDCLICTGGTGIGPRDSTPEVALSLIHKRLYGFEELMLQSAIQKTPHAAISRAVVGSIDSSLLITLPGSSKAVTENLHAILPPLAHALRKLQGDPADCA